MTKFDGLQISHRRGRRVAEDHGVDHDVKLPAGGLEVTDDGWLRVAQPDNVGVLGKLRGAAGRAGSAVRVLRAGAIGRVGRRRHLRGGLQRQGGAQGARAFIDRCEELVPSTRRDGGGYVERRSVRRHRRAHVAATPPTANGVARNKLARARLEVE